MDEIFRKKEQYMNEVIDGHWDRSLQQQYYDQTGEGHTAKEVRQKEVVRILENLDELKESCKDEDKVL